MPAGRFAFPGISAEWLREAARLDSQWRDRAGFVPDFPVMPLVGTQGRGGVVSQTKSQVTGHKSKCFVT
jgi:hypothetical protein